MHKIDCELLISLVESKPGLWDKSLDIHKDVVLRSTAWSDICRTLNPEFVNMTHKAKNVYVKTVMKKWTNIRDAWRKTITEDKRKFKPYIYHDQLKFLLKNLMLKRHDNGDEDESRERTEEDSDDASDSLASVTDRSFKKRKVRESDERETNVIQFMDVKNINSEDAHISFFRGLLPSLNKLDEDETLDFQLGVIRLLREIRRHSRPETETFPCYTFPTSSYELPGIKKDID